MAEAFVERRRSPRFAVAGGARLDRPVALTVRLLDIGLNGVLMASSQRLEVGGRARLTTRLGAINVEADVEVRRVGAPRDDGGAYQLGARFVDLDAATRRAMQQFLSAANR
jgi:hypothetical protein